MDSSKQALEELAAEHNVALCLAPIGYVGVCQAHTPNMIIPIANRNEGVAAKSAINLSASLVLEGDKVLLRGSACSTVAVQNEPSQIRGLVPHHTQWIESLQRVDWSS